MKNIGKISLYSLIVSIILCDSFIIAINTSDNDVTMHCVDNSLKLQSSYQINNIESL